MFMKKIAVFYYSQSGQTLDAIKNILKYEGSPAGKEQSGFTLAIKEIVPVSPYPFPWNSYEFFDSFPETRLCLPPSGIRPINLSDIQDAALVVIAGQSWFLSPSLPLQSFFEDNDIKQYLCGRDVVFINACRNMWLMTSQYIKDYMKRVNANLVGHIVLQDRHPNLISAVTVVKWLTHGKKDVSFFLPKAGVSNEDLAKAQRFGQIIYDSLDTNNTMHLQPLLLAAGAIDHKASVLYLEKIGHRMFGAWARFIMKKGGFRNPRRKRRVYAFYVYLIFALFFVSPFAQLLFKITSPWRNTDRTKEIDCGI